MGELYQRSRLENKKRHYSRVNCLCYGLAESGMGLHIIPNFANIPNMAPRFEIFAQGQAAEMIRYMAAHTNGVVLVSESPDENLVFNSQAPKTETQKEWDRHTLGLRPLVNIMREPPQEILDGVNNGVISLIGRAFHISDTNRFDVNDVRGKLTEVFERSLPIKVHPSSIYKGTGGERLFTRYSQDVLTPHDISVLIEKYGLASGFRKSFEEIALEQGLTKGVLVAREQVALRHLSGLRDLREFVGK